MSTFSPEGGTVLLDLEKTIPVFRIEPGQTMASNEDLGPPLRAALWAMTTVSFLFMGTRLYCRLKRHRKLQPDDMVLIASWFLLLATCIVGHMTVDLGFGRHVHTLRLRPREISRLTLLGLLCVTFVITSIAWSKTSWAMTLLAVSPTRVERACIWAGILSSNALFIASILSYWVPCMPIQKAWQPLVPGTCASPRVGMVISMVTSTYSGIMDLALAIQPWRILKDLRIGKGEKVGVALAMSMGIVAACCAFIKVSAMPGLESPDFSYAGVPLALWGALEPAVTIMAASLPMIRVLVQSWRGKGSPEVHVSLRHKTQDDEV